MLPFSSAILDQILFILAGNDNIHKTLDEFKIQHLYLDHRYPVGLAFIPRHRTPGSMPGGGVRGHNLEHP